MTSKFKVIITGKNPDYFVRNLIKQKIAIYELIKGKDYIELVVDLAGYLKLKEIKTSYKFRVVEYYGVAKIKYLIKKYLVFLIFFVLGVCFNVFLSNIIFKVEVVHSNIFIKELVYNDLKAYGIDRFNFRVSFAQKEEIVKKILAKETEHIEWLEIDEVGTKYVVKVEQRKKNKEILECDNQNIIAKKDAMILEIQAESGEVLKKKLDYVKKGDVIISGVIHNKEEIVNRKCATGKIFGEVWYQVHLELPKKYIEEKVTGKEKKQLEIVLFNNSFTLFNNFKNYKKKSFSIIYSNLFPISVNFSKYLETTVNVENYSISNVDSKAMALAQQKLRSKLGREDVIISKKVLKKIEKESKILVDVFIKVKEDITEVSDIPEEEEKEE